MNAAPAVVLTGLLLLSSVSCASGSTTAERPTTTALPTDRPVTVHVSPRYEATTPAPLVVLLHGFGSSGELQSAYLGLEAPVDANGMLLVHPDGTENRSGKRFWNATDACCAGPVTGDVDDSAYLAAVIDHVRSQYNVDPRRIYVMGHSNGGFMSYRMACDHAEVIAAVASIAGATFADPNACSPSEPVAALQVHGTDDRTIRFEGGKITGSPYPSAAETVVTWAAYNGCDLTPDRPAPPRRDLVVGRASAAVTAFTAGCEPGGAAELWSQPGGTHVPAWSATFATQVVKWLLDHPKPAA